MDLLAQEPIGAIPSSSAHADATPAAVKPQPPRRQGKGSGGPKPASGMDGADPLQAPRR